MNYCQQAAESYSKMLITEYNIIINGLRGYQHFTIYFTKDEFKHSSGIHKSIKTNENNKKYGSLAANVIYEKALKDEIDLEMITEKDSNGEYKGGQSEMVKRLYEYPYLVDYFDKADTLYLWDKNKIGSAVAADYLIQLSSDVYNGENIHIFLGVNDRFTTSNQTIKDSNRLDLSKLHFYKENGLVLYTEFSNCQSYSSKLTPLKILYKEKIEYKYINDKKIEQNFTRQICDKNFEIQMQKKGCFFPPQSSNIMQVTYNTTSQGNINLFSSGVAVAQHQRLSLKDAFTSLLNNWAEKIKASVEERRQELRNAKQEITDLKEAIAKRDEQLAEKNNEIANLKEERAKLTDQLEKQKQLVTTATKPTRSFSQNLDDFAKRIRAENAAKSQPKPNHTHTTDDKKR